MKANEELDRSEILTTLAMQVAGLYTILVASLLSIFIQQDCGSTLCTSRGSYNGTLGSNTTLPGCVRGLQCTCLTTKVACSFSDNLRNSSSFGRLTVAINFITLAVFLIAYVFFFLRERWIIKQFDVDVDLPVDNLREELELYPGFKATLGRYNLISAIVSTLLMLCLIANVVISSIFILRFRYAGKASVIGLLSNTGLVAYKAYTWFTVSLDCYRNHYAKCLFRTENVSHNTIAAGLKFKKGEYQPGA